MALVQAIKKCRDWVAESVDAFLVEERRKTYTPTAFWASNVSACPRAMYYKMTGVDAVPVPTWVSRLGDGGTDMHKRYCRYFVGMGILKTAEKRFKNADPAISGKCDAIVDVKVENRFGILPGTWVVELKSYNSNAIKYLKKPKTDAYTQVQLAMHLLPGEIKQAFILYEGRDSAEIKVFYVTYDISYITLMLAKLRILTLALKTEQLPNPPVKSRGAKLCKYCNYKIHCWGKRGKKKK